jgi:hypothetical protein
MMWVVGQFGFSYVGAIFLVALFVPNLVWARTAKPAAYDPGSESRPLRLLERVGQLLTVAAALLFTDTNLRAWSAWSWWLVAAVALLVGYEVGWARYFASARTTRDLYRSLAGVPVPLASLPVAAFLLLGVYGRLVPLVVATVVLGVGHIGIHLQHRSAG